MTDAEEKREQYIMNAWKNGYITTKMVPVFRAYLGRDWLLVKDCTKEFIKTREILYLKYALNWVKVTIRWRTLRFIGRIMRRGK